MVHRSVSFNDSDLGATTDDPNAKPKLSTRLNQYFTRYTDLFTNRRLRSATISSCVVAIGQQLCGS